MLKSAAGYRPHVTSCPARLRGRAPVLQSEGLQGGSRGFLQRWASTGPVEQPGVEEGGVVYAEGIAWRCLLMELGGLGR